MRKTKKITLKFILLLMFMSILLVLGACDPNPSISFIEPPTTYEFTTKQTYMWEPGFLTLSMSSTQMINVLYCNNESMQFFINTDNENQANSVVYNELRLINYLKYLFQDENIPFPNKIYVDELSACVSESSASRLLLNFNSIGTYRQVLATLQVIYGDYFNYGYLYALSNYIANELDWETDVIERIENDKLVDFFSSNVNALDLTYPVFTEKYASNESVKYCKALSTILFNGINNNNLLKKSVAEQENAFYDAIEQFATQNSIFHNMTSLAFAFHGDTCPLKIRASNFEMYLSDGNFIDYGNYTTDYSDYDNIIHTINNLDSEIDLLLEMFLLKNIATPATVYMYSTEACQAIHFTEYKNYCYSNVGEVHVTLIHAFLHEYAHYVEHLLNSQSQDQKLWQSQAFAELCGTYSFYSQRWYYILATKSEATELYNTYYDKEPVLGRDLSFMMEDMFCHAYDNYTPDYLSGRDQINSFSNYLCEIYGEAKIMRLMLFPDTVQEITGKDWETLRSEWELTIKNRFANINYKLS